MADLEERLVDLETRLAFQEQALLDLSDALAAALRAEQDRNPVPLRTLEDPWARPQEVYDAVYGEIEGAIETITRWARLDER